MTDVEFLLNLATRLEQMQSSVPNVNLHWFDMARLKIIAAELEAQKVQIEGMKGAIEGLIRSKVESKASSPGSLLRQATPAPNAGVSVMLCNDGVDFVSPFKPRGFA